MIGMLQAMQGYLADDPKLKTVVGPDKREFTAAIVNILYHDGRAGSQAGTIQAIAWNEQAEHLCRYEAGDEIQFIGRLNAAPAKGSGRAVLTYTIQSIDDSHTLVAAMEQFLKNFNSKERLEEKIQVAQQQKDNNPTIRETGKDLYP